MPVITLPPDTDTRRMWLYMGTAFLGAFCAALSSVDNLTGLSLLKALAVGGAAAGLAGKAFLENPNGGTGGTSTAPAADADAPSH